MNNIHYRQVRVGSPVWQRKVEEHAANGISFSVRPFNKQIHWPFLEAVCERFDLVGTFDARERTAYFGPRTRADAVSRAN